MKMLAVFCASVIGLSAAQAGGSATTTPPSSPSIERLGSVSFEVSCTPAVSAQFVRGVALLHDFWYQEAERQFQDIAKADPNCAMAHWGIAMSIFHQIWDRPSAETVARGW